MRRFNAVEEGSFRKIKWNIDDWLTPNKDKSVLASSVEKAAYILLRDSHFRVRREPPRGRARLGRNEY
jgi:hypothetical protein